jgi:acyl-CoA thioesterase
MTPQTCAQKCADIMWANDLASQQMGMTLKHISPGQAVMVLTVAPRFLNGHGTCHGGVIFTLADSAFAFACNSYNQITVAQENHITYLSPAQDGEQLIATAKEIARTGRSGVYDVTVTGQNNRQIALFRGLSRTTKGHHFTPDNNGPHDGTRDGPHDGTHDGTKIATPP